MFSLPLSHPLWRKLDDAYRQADIPATLQALSTEWDSGAADELLWGALCHQDTCYGATYAAIPHLLAIAEAPPAPEATASIAYFLGHVAKVATHPSYAGGDDPSAPQGLPDTLEAWDQKLAPYRSLAQYGERDLANQNSSEKAYQQSKLSHYHEILSRPPVDTDDLETIELIRFTFYEAMPQIAELLQANYLKTEPNLRHHDLAGIAASMGDPELSWFFSSGDEGQFACKHCGWSHEYIIFGDRLAGYASPVAPGVMYSATVDEPVMQDFTDGAPNRADGFATPSDDPRGPAAERILDLVTEIGDDANINRLRLFLGSYACTKCSRTPRLCGSA